MADLKTLIVIPARLNSTRLPRKLLLDETGKTVLEHTYHAALQSRLASEVIVAADDKEIVEAVESFGGQVEMTSADHPSGTDRVAEVAARHADFDLVVNVQGDEPELPPAAIDLAISMLKDDPLAQVSTLATPIRDAASLNDPACVKVVFDHQQRALYFSRSPIPAAKVWDDGLINATPPLFWQHIGLYAYRRHFLRDYPALPDSPLERVESLEQLRVLQAGRTLSVGQVDHPIAGIDTAEDYRLFVSRQQ
jgi:3-deoxy-manno-octulosonate cytidylyltransferase (CMP-KDO synthetase)